MPPRSNSPRAPTSSSPSIVVGLLSVLSSGSSKLIGGHQAPPFCSSSSSSGTSAAALLVRLEWSGQWPALCCSRKHLQNAPTNEDTARQHCLQPLYSSLHSQRFTQRKSHSQQRRLRRRRLLVLLPLDEIMSLQQHHHLHQQQQQQQQQQQPPLSSTTTTASISAIPSTATTTSAASHHHHFQQQHLRSSSTSPTHHHHHQQHQTRHFQQQQHRHHQLQYLPPRPPSTTSSGSLSTCGFPDDLQDDMPLPPPTPQEPPTSTSSCGVGTTTSTSAMYTFHPAHHSLLYHRHTSPHFPPQHHLLHHQHYSIPPSHQQQHTHHPPHQHHHHSSLSTEHHFGGGQSGGGSSRAASRATYVGEDEGVEASSEVEEDNLLLVDNSVGVQDAVYLDPVTTDNFLTNVMQRFKRDFIYTYVGEATLLVSVNPYKPLSIFSPRVKAAYRNISNPFQLPPHIYGQLCLILQRNTSSLERTQTLLLTGESGSGKSTNLSYLLDFLATKQEPHHHPHLHQPCRSRRNSGRSTSGGGTAATAGNYYLSTGSLQRHHHPSGGAGGGSGRASSLSLSAPSGGGGHYYSSSSPSGAHSLPNLALTLLQGNFLLNAFGNCKTGKNWDASRFGKLVQLQVDFLGNVCGGRIVTYQLEKWRVQGPIGGGDYERNFHIFYILVAGADSSTLKTLRLCRNLEMYAMLNVKNHSSFLNASGVSTPSAPYCPHDHYYNMKGTGKGSSSSHSTSSSSTSHYEGCFHLIKTTLVALLPSSSSISADHVFRMLAAILKLNNLVFAPVANIDGSEGCDVTNEQDLHDIGMLLQITSGQSNHLLPLSSPSTPNNGNNNNGGGNSSHQQPHPLKVILTTRRVTRSDGSVANIELTASESSSLRNALCVSLYTRLFSWLTKQVCVKPCAASTTAPTTTTTTTTATSSSSTSAPPPSVVKHNLLNIVDFYGFEVFQSNSLEQFLINFTNEKIHFVLADLRLRMLQEEFVRDGLEWIIIDTASASSCSSSTSPNSAAAAPAGKLIELIEENCHGLLSIFANCANDHELERQCSRRFSSREPPPPQEMVKESNLCSTTQKSPPLPPPSVSSSTASNNNALLVEYLHQSFRLRHWAGPVVYSTRHFASKNRDTLPPHLPHQLYTWTADPLLRSLFSHDGRSAPSAMDSVSSRLLATSNMELSLKNLFQKCCGGVTKASHQRIYHVRCLKPNELSQPEVCEPALLKHQVRYHRLIDFVRVYRDGFTYNLGAFEFLERYKLLSLNTWPNWRHPQEIRLGIQVLMKDLQMKEGLDWCFGGGGGTSHGPLLHHNHPSSSGSTNGETLKVYLKGQRILSELEDFRRERLDDLALLIQKVWRGYRDWRRWNRMRSAYSVICHAWKSYLQCKRKEQRKLWKQMRNAVKLIQQRYILWKRRLFLRQLILQIRAELQRIQQQQGGGTVAQICGPASTQSQLQPSSGTAGPSATGMLSPVSKDWPYPPSYLEEASYHLKRVFHRWRCRLYRSRFNEVARAKMAEKVTASLLFRDKKTSYLRSVSHPFLGDYIRLRQNSQWRRTTMMMMLQTVTHSQQLPHVPSTASAAVAAALEDAARSAAAAAAAAAVEEGGDSSKKPIPLLPSQQLQIVFADLINKITRSSGKFLPIVLVVTTTQIMILDPRTLNIKYKIPATEVWRLSVSPYGDDICVLHLQHPRIGGVGGPGGSVLGPGEQGNLFGGMLSDDDDAYYQFGDEPSPTVGNFGAGGCMCSSGNTGGVGGGGFGGGGFGGGYYSSGAAGGGGESPPSSQAQHQCQPGSGGCGLFGGGDSDSGHYTTSEIVKLTKGDLVLHTCHLIEMVTKIFLVVKNATGRGPELVISNEFPAIFNNQRVQLYFRYYSKKPNPGHGSKVNSGRVHPPPAGGGDTGACALPSALDDHHHQNNPPVAPLSLPLTLPDGPCASTGVAKESSCLTSVPPPPPAPALVVSSGSGREEQVIPPSQIKITRKKSTRMEFLIGSGGHS